MTLSAALRELIAAAFSGIWIHSDEHPEALREIAALSSEEEWRLLRWDIDTGLHGAGEVLAPDPLTALRVLPSLANPKSSTLLILSNFHKFLSSPEILQCMANVLHTGKTNRTFILILAPLVQIPLELQRQFCVLEHALPAKDQLCAIAREIADEPGELPEGPELDRLLDAAAGLTRNEAENAFSLGLVREGKLSPSAVWELKVQMLKKSGLLSLHRGKERFADLGGLDALKTFCTRALSSSHPIARPRGVLLLGVPGTGKSAFAKALGNETGRPTLTVDIGALMGSLVGSTESNVRQALRIIDAMAPCVAFIDEVDKALSGVASSGQTDSGVSARLFGSLLTWLNDHTSDVFVVMTCNDITKLPPEFSRSERFDGILFLDLPSTAEKQAIWKLYQEHYQLPSQELPTSPDWTGAEIKACCRLAALLNVSLIEAAKQVVPVAATAAESVDKLRSWASGRCLSASTPGLYLRPGTTHHTTTGRRIPRSASN